MATEIIIHPWIPRTCRNEVQTNEQTSGRTGTAETIHRGSYMSAHVLLNLFNELGKRDKMRGLSSILSLFRNEFNKFNNTRARMLDSIYHMTLRLLWNLISAVKRYNFVIMYPTLLWTSITIHHERPCRIEISHLRGRKFNQGRGLPSPWLNSDPEGEISLSYMDRLMMDRFSPTFQRVFVRT